MQPAIESRRDNSQTDISPLPKLQHLRPRHTGRGRSHERVGELPAFEDRDIVFCGDGGEIEGFRWGRGGFVGGGKLAVEMK